MGLRGLLWTFPSGYLLHHAGYGAAFALSGAVMPAVYSLAQYAKPAWTADGWQPKKCASPDFEEDWVRPPPPPDLRSQA
jgi:hypothetical protein